MNDTDLTQRRASNIERDMSGPSVSIEPPPPEKPGSAAERRNLPPIMCSAAWCSSSPC